MSKKLHCILLIDDHEPTNYLHKMVISMADVAEKVIIYQDANKALDYLNDIAEQKIDDKIPELIFVDLNMPGMDGWDFLDGYHKLNGKTGNNTTIIMLSSSENPADKKKALSYAEVSDFINKPLDSDILSELMQRHFNNN